MKTTVDLLEGTFAAKGVKVWPRMTAPITNYGTECDPMVAMAQVFPMDDQESLGAFVTRILKQEQNVAVYQMATLNNKAVVRLALW